MEYIGHAPPGSYDRVVVRGDLAAREFQAFWLHGRRAIAAMHVNLWDEGIDPLKALVASGRALDADRLANAAIPLGDV
jgi:3-phenylpropionate/trans-cinnamate dioxygenase ferredoxin reductase subunit